MKCRLCALVAVATLSACASQGTPGSNTASQSALPQIDAHRITSRVEQVLYRFRGDTDGAYPEPELIAVGNTLYGTTFQGGNPACAYAFYGSVGCGTVFKIDTSGSGYAVLHRFGKTATGGMFPTLGVIDKNATLFGTAFYGGGDGSRCDQEFNGCGTLYQIDPTGKGFKVLHDFAGGDDGAGPFANVVGGRNNTLYGATNEGGAAGCASQGGCGVVYAFDLASGTESTVYSFKGGTDGSDPIGLIDEKGTLYGVTYFGRSASGCPSGPYTGCGTIFKIDPGSGKERILYRFKGGKDGAFPDNVLSIDGNLYGAAEHGGGPACAGSGFTGCGMIFKVSGTSGAEKVLHRFKGGEDGENPNQILANINGTLYGTTIDGGGSSCNGFGCGTIYKIHSSGKGYAVVYSFRGGHDGANPISGVTAVNGTLYGTTATGGGKGCGGGGCGTVFEATP